MMLFLALLTAGCTPGAASRAPVAAAAAAPGPKGLHSSTFQLNLSPSNHYQIDANQRIPQKVLTLS